MRLTKRVIDAAAVPRTGAVFLRDEGLRGFGLKITSKGTKTFFIEKRVHGRSRRMSLGRYGDITLEQARTLGQAKCHDIAQGKNPADDRKTQRTAATWQDLETLYLDRHAIHKKSKSNDVGMLNKWLAAWRPRRLSSLTRSDISALHADMGAKGHTTGANRMIALVRTMFFRGKDWGVFEGENPASRIKFFKEVKRDRFVQIDELPRLWKALQNEPNPYVRGAVLVGLLTGARRNEVLQMKWTDVDLRTGVWTIPETKAGRPHYLPLPRLVIQELRTLPKLADNPYVFCGRWGKSHLINIAKPWRHIRNEAKLNDVRLHDLRRTLGSWLVAAGASLPLIGKTLNHSRPETTQIYARLQLGPVKDALEANAERMMTVITDGSDES